MDHLFDYENCKKFSQDTKVNVRKTYKGLSLFASQDIVLGETIAYYHTKIFTFNEVASKNEKYRVALNVFGGTSDTFVADIYEDSLLEPINRISYLGYLANEPSPGQKSNCYLLGKNNWEEYEFICYKLIATKKIKKGEEICWYYGEEYERDYEIDL